MQADGRKTRVALLSVVCTSIIVAAKVAVGVAISSVSVISEAIHSGVDLLAAVIALLAVRASCKPADAKHQFGHGKFENLSGTVEALLIFAAAGWIIYESVRKLLTPHTELDAPLLGVAVMAVSAGVNLVVSHMLFKVGRETDSPALMADGWHLRTDVYTSAGVMAGLAIIALGDAFFPALGDRLHVIDPLAAIVVAALIIRAAWRLTVQSARDLMDVQLPPDEQAWVLGTIRSFAPQVHGVHGLRTRKAGAERFIEFHIWVMESMSVKESHRLAHQIGDRIKGHFEGASVLVHVEPCSGGCSWGEHERPVTQH